MWRHCDTMDRGSCIFYRGLAATPITMQGIRRSWQDMDWDLTLNMQEITMPFIHTLREEQMDLEDCAFDTDKSNRIRPGRHIYLRPSLSALSLSYGRRESLRVSQNYQTREMPLDRFPSHSSSCGSEIPKS